MLATSLSRPAALPPALYSLRGWLVAELVHTFPAAEKIYKKRDAVMAWPGFQVPLQCRTVYKQRVALR